MAATTLLTIFLTDCTVGPNYSRPDVPAAPAYRGPDNSTVSGNASLADEKWWELFKDVTLQQLIHTALEQNYDLRIAASRVIQAQQQVIITRSNQFPTVGAGPAVSGVKSPAIPGIFAGYSYIADALNLTASWNPDFWGRYRRATEGARANLRATEWGRRAIVGSLVESVAADYLQLREYDLELEIEKRSLASRKQSLALTQTLERGGASSMVDVRQAEQLVEQAAELIPESEQAIQQEENAISLLLGQNPGSIPRGQPITEQLLSTTPANPDEVPAGLPSQLLERRPDIQEAEQTLVAANAQIGVARAQLFPQISLTGTGGVESIGLGNIFTWGARAWTYSATATQPVFYAGALRANVRLSEAQKEQAVLTYQEDIRTAFEQVSNALIANRKLRDYRGHQEALTEAARDASNLAQIRYKGGVTGYLEVLTNETNFLAAEIALARARLAERLALVQLYNALGGGWQQ
jgi:multidrug efflux system outer membrane protein